MLHTPLCDLLGIQVPIIQAGMGWDKEGMTTPPKLVAAVSNAGGLGCIGGSSIRPEVIRERIRAVRQLTDKPFGVDITLPKMEDVKIPDPDEVRKEIEEKYPRHAKFTDELIPKLGLAPQPHHQVDASDLVALRRYRNFTDRYISRREVHQLMPIFQIIVLVLRIVGIKIRL